MKLILITTAALLFLISCKKDKSPKDENPPVQYYADGQVIPLLKSDVSTAVNVVILGDGFIKDDLTVNGIFDKQVHAMINYMFTVAPYSDYKKYFNAYALCTPSQKRGAGTNEPAEGRKFKSFFWGTINDRLVVVGTDSVDYYAKKALPEGKIANIIIMLVNDEHYGGSGGTYSVTTNNERYREVIIHEMGHSFGGLGDEYADPVSEPFYSKDLIPYLPNLDTSDDPAKVKWSSYLSLSAYQNIEGVFEGGYYAEKGVYRPEYTSLMRELNVYSYNAPSREAIVRHICDIVGMPFNLSDFLEQDKAHVKPVIGLAVGRLPANDFINPAQHLKRLRQHPNQ